MKWGWWQNGTQIKDSYTIKSIEWLIFSWYNVDIEKEKLGFERRIYDGRKRYVYWICCRLFKRIDTLLDKLTLFRGQGNKEWDLMPSVMRNREDYLNEELYIKECIRQYPEEFINMSKIDMLIKMQHYGVPTRLLDLTSTDCTLLCLHFRAK